MPTFWTIDMHFTLYFSSRWSSKKMPEFVILEQYKIGLYYLFIFIIIYNRFIVKKSIKIIINLITKTL